MTRPRMIAAELEIKIDLAEGLALFRFSLERDFRFKAGQYATIWLTHRGKTTPRPYSIASSPSQPRTLEFYINLVAEGHLTPSLWDPEVLDNLRRRDAQTRVGISGPKGLLVLDAQDPRDLVFVASGTGLAPFISMIRKLNEDIRRRSETARGKTVWVIHGVSYSANLGYHEELQRLAAATLRDPIRTLPLVYLPTISRPHMDPAWTGLRGRAETLFEEPPDGKDVDHGLSSIVRGMLRTSLRPETHVVYICGHPGTVDNVVAALRKHGFSPGKDLKHERYFHPVATMTTARP